MAGDPPPAGDDRRPSRQLRHIPTLLRSGFTVEDICAVTGVPQALVELIAEEQQQQAKPHLHSRQRSEGRTSTPKAPRVRRVARVVIALSAVNICLTAAALIWHLPALAAWGTGGALTIIAATFLLARRASPPTGRPIRKSPGEG